MRRLGVNVRLFAVAAMACTLSQSSVVAQGDREYLALFERYANGETIDAVAALAAWPEARVRDAVKSLDEELPLSAARLRTAVLLHTEAAFVDPDSQRESFHLDVARSFIGRLLALPRVPTAVRDFAARFQALWAVVYCTRGEPAIAQVFVNSGRGIDRNNRFVNLIAGALIEYRVGQAEPNPRGTWNVDPQHEYGLKKQLHQAAQIYRGIVANAPSFYEGRLRLGWVLALNDSLENAREQLEAVAAQATRPDLAYLAHMFLGSLNEREKRPADATREYAAARAVSPFQSSLMALMRMASARGENERVRSLFAEISAIPPDQDDPWSFYSLCGTSGTSLLDGLRAEAMR
jgi:hypothetical protein